MNKYFRYYFIDSFLIILYIVLEFFFSFTQVSLYSDFAGSNFLLVPSILIVISLIFFIYNVIASFNKKLVFTENNTLFPKYYLVFIILLVVLGLIYNALSYLKGVHTGYYFTFAMVGYTMLSIYTTLSFKKRVVEIIEEKPIKKQVKKKTNKKNK